MTPTTRSQPLWTLTRIIRSKNAGPFQLTIDLLFRSDSDYEWVSRSGVLSRESVARAYNIAIEQVQGVYFWDAARAIKITLDRAVSAGSPGDNDCYGAQQHAPLLYVTMPERSASDAGQRRSGQMGPADILPASISVEPT